MKVTVIGSGSMWTKFNSACYLINDNTMIDFPNGCSKYLYRVNINPSNIENILLTHFHGDHYFDLPFLILNKSKSNNKILNIFCSKDGKKKINKLGVLAFPNSIKSATKEINLKYNYTTNFMINNLKVTKIQVDHGRMKPAYAYIFKDKDKYIGFTGDSKLCSNIEVMAHKCNYLFCDVSFINGTNKHMGIDNIIYLANKYRECTFITSHMSDEVREELLKLNISNIEVPSDYKVYEI